eukprot:188401_1
MDMDISPGHAIPTKEELFGSDSDDVQEPVESLTHNEPTPTKLPQNELSLNEIPADELSQSDINQMKREIENAPPTLDESTESLEQPKHETPNPSGGSINWDAPTSGTPMESLEELPEIDDSAELPMLAPVTIDASIKSHPDSTQSHSEDSKIEAGLKAEITAKSTEPTGDDGYTAEDLFGSESESDGAEAPSFSASVKVDSEPEVGVRRERDMDFDEDEDDFGIERNRTEPESFAEERKLKTEKVLETAQGESIRTRVKRMVMPESDSKIFTIRFPETIQVKSEPFEGEEEELGDVDHTFIRWRYTNPEHTLKESNARLVTWSDGSRQLVVGSRTFDVDQHASRKHCSFLYANANDQSDVKLCHGAIQGRLVVSNKKAREINKKKIAGKHQRQIKVKQIPTLDFLSEDKLEDERKRAADKIKTMQRRARARDIRRQFQSGKGRTKMTAAFLEGRHAYSDEDEEEEEYNALPAHRYIPDQDEERARESQLLRAQQTNYSSDEEARGAVSTAVDMEEDDVEVHSRPTKKRKTALIDSDSDE